MEEVKDMDMKERTDALINVKSFSICSAPISVIKDFKDFCKLESKNDYSLGLKILLERNRMNFQQEIFAIKIQELEGRLEALETKPQEPVEKKEKIKTFGGDKV